MQGGAHVHPTYGNATPRPSSGGYQSVDLDESMARRVANENNHCGAAVEVRTKPSPIHVGGSRAGV